MQQKGHRGDHRDIEYRAWNYDTWNSGVPETYFRHGGTRQLQEESRAAHPFAAGYGKTRRRRLRKKARDRKITRQNENMLQQERSTPAQSDAFATAMKYTPNSEKTHITRGMGEQERKDVESCRMCVLCKKKPGF